MKQFFGAFFGSIIGIVIATVLGIFVLVAVLKSSFNSAMKDDNDSVVKENSVIRINLSGIIKERENENPLEELRKAASMNDEESAGLNTIIAKIDQAASDSKIKGLYLHFDDLHAGLSTSQDLRAAFLRFKKAGKFVYAYGESYSCLEYYLASVADKVFVHPQGDVDWKGLSMQMMFFKNTLEKLDIDVQVFRHGQFKSAIEPFILDKMSAANREQSRTYIGSIWWNIVDAVSASRKIPAAELQGLANDLEFRFPDKQIGKLVDALAYDDEVVSEIKKKIQVNDSIKYKFTDFDKYKLKSKSGKEADGNRVAVIYANGAIGGGEGNEEEVGSAEIIRTIKKARLDKKVKAIVLRVNSPGGSALASDVIWREIVLAKKSKPVVASMGDVAASGGYYISCGADRIFAQPNTITGSIGVFGLLPNISRMLNNKLGITLDTINTNQYSDIGSTLRMVKKEEGAYIQSSVERIYSTFLTRVAEGRGMPVSDVDSIGQGRVWSGSDALKLKLVDEMGGLNDAITWVAKKAGLKEYKVVELPKQKNPLQALLGDKDNGVEDRILKNKLGTTYNYISYLSKLAKMKGVQARLPFEFELK